LPCPPGQLRVRAQVRSSAEPGDGGRSRATHRHALLVGVGLGDLSTRDKQLLWAHFLRPWTCSSTSTRVSPRQTLATDDSCFSAAATRPRRASAVFPVHWNGPPPATFMSESEPWGSGHRLRCRRADFGRCARIEPLADDSRVSRCCGQCCRGRCARSDLRRRCHCGPHGLFGHG